jgi:hypothetical protein
MHTQTHNQADEEKIIRPETLHAIIHMHTQLHTPSGKQRASDTQEMKQLRK